MFTVAALIQKNMLYGLVLSSNTYGIQLLIYFIDPLSLNFATIARPILSGHSVIASLSLKSLDIVVCNLLSLWNFHWKFVFDGQLYWLQEVVTSANRLDRKTNNETNSRCTNTP
ncbi:hypothetical protein G6F60_009519 [Rhizopus arrhizus]|nr:hypothetical protein G6F60_009519 [Rhizopus arrhizus]